MSFGLVIIAVSKEWTVGPEWAGLKPLRLRHLLGRVVVVRFWTDTLFLRLPNDQKPGTTKATTEPSEVGR